MPEASQVDTRESWKEFGMVAISIKTSALLIVEDDPAILDDTTAALRDQGFEVLSAKDAQAALKLLETRADIGVMVTDIEMPGMDGLQLSRIVRDRFPPMEIIVVSEADRPSPVDIPQRALFLSKPINLQELSKAIRGFGAQL